MSICFNNYYIEIPRLHLALENPLSRSSSSMSSEEMTRDGYTDYSTNEGSSPIISTSPEPVDTACIRIKRLGCRLGSGSFGTVYEGIIVNRWKREKKAALKKFLKEEYLQDEFHRTQVLFLEMERCKIPGVATLYGLVEEKNDQYLAMKLCNQGNLKSFLSLLQEENPDKKRLLQIAIAVGTSIANLHRAGFVHHDIKLDNVLVHYKNNAFHFYLGDMGLVGKVDLKHPMPKIFNWLFAPPQVLHALNQENQPLMDAMWNDTRYDDSMFGLLLWQIFTNSLETEKLPWNEINHNDPKSKVESKRLNREMADSLLFAEHFNWFAEEVQGIIKRLRSWGKDHLSTEQAIIELQRLLI